MTTHAERESARLATTAYAGRPPLQIVATRGHVPARSAAVATITCHESRKAVKFGPQPCTDIRFMMAGFVIDTSAGGEVALANGYTVLAALEKVSPSVAKVASLGGKKAIVIEAGAGFVMTDPIGLDMAASEVAQVQYEARAAQAADALPSDLYGLVALSSVSLAYRSALSTGQIGTAGTWSATSRTANQNVGCVSAIVGLPQRSFPSVVVLGDSIAEGREDNSTGDAAGNHGYIQRGLYAGGPGGVAVPYTTAAVSGEKWSTIAAGGATQRLTLLKYCSHVIVNYGINDIGGGASLATLQSNFTTGVTSIKRYGVKVYACKLTPRTTSSDSWATLANQTLATGHDVGGIRDQFNAWLDTQVGSTIDGVIDPNPYCESGSTGKWVVDGNANYATADGIHPSVALCVLMASAVANVSKSFRVDTRGNPL